MQLKKVYRRTRARQLYHATLNAAALISGFVDDGAVSFLPKIEVALGEFMLSGGVLDELQGYDDFQRVLKRMRKEQTVCQKKQRNK